MDTLVLQLSIKHGRVADLVRSEGQPITVGRALDNDAVLTDPYVAPHQLRFDKEGSDWYAQVLEQQNPVSQNGDVMKETRFQVQSGDRVTIGRTRLNVFAADHRVEATRTLILSSSMYQGKSGLLIAFAVLVFVALLDGFSDYTQLSVDDDWGQYMYSALMGGLIIIIWAGFWSIMGRLFRHQQQFSLQLLATSLVLLALIFIAPVPGYLEFMTNSLQVSQVSGYLMALIFVTTLLRFNLALATHVENTWRVAAGLSIVIVGFSYLMGSLESEEFTASAEYSEVLKPPFAPRPSAQNLDQYFEQLNQKVEWQATTSN
ncbi:MAG: hypothetical protein ACJASY_003411 [Halioglobus sp.]|jgi:hypothetical protein